MLPLVVSMGHVSASGHDMLIGGQAINPPRLEAERDNAKLNFLASQARRNGVDMAKVTAARSIYYDKYLWPKTELRVCFWNGTEEVQREVMQIADTWHQAVPDITFNYQENGRVRQCNLTDLKTYKTSTLKDFKLMPDIRIAMAGNDNRPIYHPQDSKSKSGDWAYPGKSVALNPEFPVTMNLVGAVMSRQNQYTDDYYFNVRHEFGHALGLVHEHQRELCKGWFNVEQIAKDTGWDLEVARKQVDAINESSNVYGVIGDYDIHSIMQYNFKLSWYMPDAPGNPNPCRRKDMVTDLSALDKVVVAALYQPSLNGTPERLALIEESKRHAEQALASQVLPSAGKATSQTPGIEAALADFEKSMRKASKITIQVYPHKVDKDVVLRAIANLGYPLTNQAGKPIRTVSENTTASLRQDPTNTLLYTSDVSDQDVRYVALALMRAGIEVKSLQPYTPAPRNKFAKRESLVQIGADTTNRDRRPLSVQEVLDSPLPLFGQPKTSE